MRRANRQPTAERSRPLALLEQVWRLFTNFFFFGPIGLDFLFHMFFLVRYCRLLEEGSFRGRTADFVAMLLFGAHSTLGPRAVDGSAHYSRDTRASAGGLGAGSPCRVLAKRGTCALTLTLTLTLTQPNPR